jgi:hypothetical protein
MRGLACVAVVAAFMCAVGRYYDPEVGFTHFIEFSADGHEQELPRVQSVPHRHGDGYDGQFYAQMAVTPLLRDPAIDRALDSAPYRARRILIAWTAWVVGLGQPARVLHAFALQNVVCWLAIAALLARRWLPPTSWWNVALWSGCLWAHGLIASVRFALADGPSALLLCLAVVGAETERAWLTASIVGLAGLARETNLLGAVVLARFVAAWPPRLTRGAALFAIVLLPTLLWIDYLRSIYRSALWVGGGLIVWPLQGYLWKWRVSVAERDLGSIVTVASLATLVALTSQGCFLLRIGRLNPWWQIGVAFLGLAVVAHPAVWEGAPGAITRVCLPMTLACNILLAREARERWWWFGPVNLTVLPAVVGFVMNRV